MPAVSLETVIDLVAFFRDELNEARGQTGLETSEETEAYLVHMLDGFARLNPTTAEEVGFHKPAARLLEEAIHSQGDQRIDLYRRLGDASLYSCGFFDAYLSQSSVGPRYYRRVGQTAYAQLSDLMGFKQPGGIFPTIYRELTSKFDEVVETFRLVGQRAVTHSRKGVLLDRLGRGREVSIDELAAAGLLTGEGGDA